MTIPVDQLVGPFGALVVLSFLVAGLAKAVQVLWADHKRADQDDRDQRDRALGLVEGIVPTLKELTAAQLEANRRAAASHRRDDAG